MEKRILLNAFDVVCLKTDESFSCTHTSKVIDLVNSLIRGYGLASSYQRGWCNISDDLRKQWLFLGVEAQVLQSGKEWRRGKLCVSIQFIPDDDDDYEEEEEEEVEESAPKALPPSPLDDLRQQLKDLNQ
ncbi:MAG: hypothetical protein N3E45_17070 [Oscillatoriaceae bacterium SKW80]|nr:hypothetical protein [Oscillatoriaceae bacterium SKW80]HIK27971.1 hypothetical protein [Oscillatoriaceae cyanobacterium M7585_C2015_266]